MNEEVFNILVVGIDLVALAHSARRAGYVVHAADYFGDLDLRQTCKRCISIVQQRQGLSTGRLESNFRPEAFLGMARALSDEVQIDALLISSGLDDHFDVLHELNELIPIVGNSPDIIRRVRVRDTFFRELERLGIPHPLTSVARSIEEAISSARETGYPVVLKPLEGFAGSAVRVVEDQRQLERTFRDVDSHGVGGILVQEYICGVHASVSFLAAPTGAKILSVNEQLLGLKKVHQHEPFGYCGNIVPIHVKGSTRKKCENIAERISYRFGLRGSNGIDLVISKSGILNVIEVNPRFQGTLECVERALGLNLVRAHINACFDGSLPRRIPEPAEFVTRLILYAPVRASAPDLRVFENVRDIPLPGAIIEEGEPLCSIITVGNRRSGSLRRAYDGADSIYRMLSQHSNSM